MARFFYGRGKLTLISGTTFLSGNVVWMNNFLRVFEFFEDIALEGGKL